MTRTLSSPRARGEAARRRRPTLHLLGAGRVGREFLRLLDARRYRLAGASDSSGTVVSTEALDPRALADWKAAGRPLAELPRAKALDLDAFAQLFSGDALIDCTATDPAHAVRAAARARTFLDNGARVIFASKAALACGAEELFARRSRLGVHAALGGTGLSLLRQLDELRARCRGIAAVPNVTTTCVIRAVERGATVDEGIAAARQAGLVESDPTLDLNGSDAALKLAIVAGAVFGRTVPLDALSRPDLRSLDPELLRERFRRGRTTRLVARAALDRFSLDYEEIGGASSLAVDAAHVVYCYELDGGERRAHIGGGVGTARTARALLADLDAAFDGGSTP